MAEKFEPAPPHDCRLTKRCLDGLGLDLDGAKTFRDLCEGSDVVRHFFERRESDAQGGEHQGDRVRQIRSRPAFKLTSGRWRGATWFDKSRPPQAICWLLGVEWHDDRAKGRSDAYDILGALDERGSLFPAQIDYKLLELDRRRLDTDSFSEDAARDADRLVQELRRSGSCGGEMAGVPVRAQLERESLHVAHVAVSCAPVQGPRSGRPFPLTSERYELLKAAFTRAIEAATRTGEALAGDATGETPFRLGNERAFFVIFDER